MGEALTNRQKKRLRQIAHHLDPIVTVGEGGLNAGVREETNRALADHELIKVRFTGDRETRRAAIAALAEDSAAEIVQTIGKIAVLYRYNKKPNTKLSNVCRFLGSNTL